MSRILISEDPFADADNLKSLWGRGSWPGKWLEVPAEDFPTVWAFRCRLRLDQASTIRIHVSADERYALFLNGNRLGRGPERCDEHAWTFETYDLDLPIGDHVFVARVAVLKNFAPFAQESVKPGFLMVAEDRRHDELVTTGVACWECKKLEGHDFIFDPSGWMPFTGARDLVDLSKIPQGYLFGEGKDWQPAEAKEPPHRADWHGTGVPAYSHRMQPARLPAMREQPWLEGKVRWTARSIWTGETPLTLTDSQDEEIAAWENWLKHGAALVIPPHSKRAALIDAEDYVCAYPEITVSEGQGARVTLGWAESLHLNPNGAKDEKGHRDEIAGKYFADVPDEWICDGSEERLLETLWWRAGRYLLLNIQTADSALRLDRFVILETRYPLEFESKWQALGFELESIIQPCVRAMQMCAHETYMDCPYYEQLMYVGDTRLEMLTTYCLTHDARLPRKGIELFGQSRQAGGLTRSRHPSRMRQDIPPFALWWVCMLHDYALWRNDSAFVREHLPAARGIIDTWLGYRNEAGLVAKTPGWNFVDWARPVWSNGIPPSGEMGISSVLNWQLVYTLTVQARLEDWLGEPENAVRYRRHAAEISEKLRESFWDSNRHLFADDASKECFSEHAQCLALLSETLDAETAHLVSTGLFEDKDLIRTTIYFSHYLFETCRQQNRMDVFWQRLDLWSDLAKLGFKTTYETPEPSRSDCHAWGAHPLYHLYASVLGIRPTTLGFETLEIVPQLGPLTEVNASLVHPRGLVEVQLKQTENQISGRVRLPENVAGIWRSTTEIPLIGGQWIKVSGMAQNGDLS